MIIWLIQMNRKSELFDSFYFYLLYKICAPPYLWQRSHRITATFHCLVISSCSLILWFRNYNSSDVFGGPSTCRRIVTICLTERLLPSKMFEHMPISNQWTKIFGGIRHSHICLINFTTWQNLALMRVCPRVKTCLEFEEVVGRQDRSVNRPGHIKKYLYSIGV